MFRFHEVNFLLVGLFDWGICQNGIFFRYPGIGMVSHWRDTEMENLLTLP